MNNIIIDQSKLFGFGVFMVVFFQFQVAFRYSI